MVGLGDRQIEFDFQSPLERDFVQFHLDLHLEAGYSHGSTAVTVFVGSIQALHLVLMILILARYPMVVGRWARLALKHDFLLNGPYGITLLYSGDLHLQ